MNWILLSVIAVVGGVGPCSKAKAAALETPSFLSAQILSDDLDAIVSIFDADSRKSQVNESLIIEDVQSLDVDQWPLQILSCLVCLLLVSIFDRLWIYKRASGTSPPSFCSLLRPF